MPSKPSRSDWIMRLVPAAVLAGVVLLGDGARREYVVDDVQVTRQGWDSLRVGFRFARTTTFGGHHPITPKVATVHLFSRSLDTLYTGEPGWLAIPDAELGDAEPLLIEVCGDVGAGKPICEQRGLSASPKRVRVEEDITYPDEDDLHRGRYALQFHLERRTLDGLDWEPIERRRSVDGYLRAYVDGQAEEGVVQIPFSRTEGRFNLSRRPGYEDFSYYLKSRLLDADEAVVHFDVYAALGSVPVRLASVEKRVQAKTREERTGDVYDFVELAAAQVLEAIEAEPAGDGAVAWIDEWQFSRLSNAYIVKMEIEWRVRRTFRTSRYRLNGILQVGEQGRSPSFRFTGGNDRAREAWTERYQDRTLLELYDLELPDYDEEAFANPERLDSW